MIDIDDIISWAIAIGIFVLLLAGVFWLIGKHNEKGDAKYP